MPNIDYVLADDRDIDAFFSNPKIIWLMKNEYDLITTRNESNQLLLRGSRENINHAKKVINVVNGKIKDGVNVSIKKFNCLISLEKDNALDLENELNKIVIGKTKSKNGGDLMDITPMTLGQFELVTQLLSDSVETVLATGEAGSGKTYLTVCVAALLAGLVNFSKDDHKKLEKAIHETMEKAYKLGCLPKSLHRYMEGTHFRIHDDINNIVVLRPIVATQDIGFLPGTAEEKVEPYLKQVFAYLNEIPEEYRSKKFTNMISGATALLKGNENASIPTDLVALAKAMSLIKVELVELARGANFRNAFILGDELENVPTPIFEMLLDRAEDNCKIAFSGDIRQCDLKPGVISGLALYSDMYKRAKDEDLWCAAVVDLPDVLRSVRTKANRKLLAKYLEERKDLKEQFNKGQYSHGVQATPNKGR